MTDRPSAAIVEPTNSPCPIPSRTRHRINTCTQGARLTKARIIAALRRAGDVGSTKPRPASRTRYDGRNCGNRLWWSMRWADGRAFF